MRNFNVVRLDSKGRMILPYHIRDFLGLKKGSELLIVNNEKKELKIFPLKDKKTAKIRITINSNSFSSILNILDKYKIDVLMSIGKTIERDKLSGWEAIIDFRDPKQLKKMEKELKSLKGLKKIDID